MNDERGSWYLLTGLLLGIGLGLLYAWVVSPAEYVDTPPFSLREDYKDRYRAVIAAAYVASRDVNRAQARLALLQDDDPSLALVAQAQRYLATGQDLLDAQAMADLASALGQAPTPLPTLPEETATFTATNSPSDTPTVTLLPSATITETSVPDTAVTETITVTLVGTARPTHTPTLTRTPGPTPTPSKTPTLTPSRTPTATLAPPFVLDNQVEVCNPLVGEPQIQVFVSNAAGVGIPGVEVIVLWRDGEEHFYTGLKPDIDPGYADFVMQPETTYTLQVGDGGQVISDLVSPACTDGGGNPYWGSWRLVFSHP
jgi:hypothetical protein